MHQTERPPQHEDYKNTHRKVQNSPQKSLNSFGRVQIFFGDPAFFSLLFLFVLWSKNPEFDQSFRSRCRATYKKWVRPRSPSAASHFLYVARHRDRKLWSNSGFLIHYTKRNNNGNSAGPPGWGGVPLGRTKTFSGIRQFPGIVFL